jgi:hypothetical protein
MNAAVRKLLTCADAFWPLFVFTIACKFTFGFWYYAHQFGASELEMGRLVHNIYSGQGIANVYFDGSGPSAHVTPIYPHYLAALMWLFGDGEGWVLAFQIVSLIAACVAVALLPGLARVTGLGFGCGLAAALFLAVSPFGINYEKLGISENAFVVLGLVVTFRRIAQPERFGVALSSAAITGVLLGVLALLIPVVMPGILGALAADYATASDWTPRRRLTLGTTLLASALVIFPWIYRNYRVLGGVVPMRSNFGLELYIGNHDHADGHTFEEPRDPQHGFETRHPLFSAKEQVRYKELGELNYHRDRRDAALAWIGEHPAHFAWLTGVRFCQYWFPTVGRDMSLARSLWFGFLSIGSVVALVLMYWERHPFRWHYLAMLIGPSLPFMITHVSPRYRFFTIWVSTLLTAYALDKLRQFAFRARALPETRTLTPSATGER